MTCHVKKKKTPQFLGGKNALKVFFLLIFPLFFNNWCSNIYIFQMFPGCAKRVRQVRSKQVKMSLFIGSKWRKTCYKKWAFKSDGEETFFHDAHLFVAVNDERAAGIQGHAANYSRLQNDDEWNLLARFQMRSHCSAVAAVCVYKYELFFLYFFSALLSCPHMFLAGKTGLTRSLKGFYNHFFFLDQTGKQRCRSWRRRRAETVTAKYENIFCFNFNVCRFCERRCRCPRSWSLGREASLTPTGR